MPAPSRNRIWRRGTPSTEGLSHWLLICLEPGSVLGAGARCCEWSPESGPLRSLHFAYRSTGSIGVAVCGVDQGTRQWSARGRAVQR